MRFMSLVMILFSCFATSSIGGETTWILGGEATKKLVDNQRGKTPLSKLAMAMMPG